MYNKIPVGRAENLIGKKYNKLTVLYRVKNVGKHTAWMCECECGNKHIVRSDFLQNGHTTSCGCNNTKNLSGKKFGYLTVLYKTEKRSSKCVVWHCKCECGNEVDVQSTHLLSGHTKSCGCFQKIQAGLKNTKNISNQRFGYLTAIEPTGERKGRDIVWKCNCDCGNIHYATTHQLISKQIQSCGCWHKSQGEVIIENIFNSNNIDYIFQKKFDTCKKKTFLPFDFFVNNQYLVEYDGEQHYKIIDAWGGESAYLLRKEYDEYKNQWCKENNIPLIRIPYTKLNTLSIEDLLLETTQFRVV